jgi:serine/threonine protein phosphatase PrpC
MQPEFGAATDVGRKRPHNEDSYRAEPGLGLFLVADGMGGHAAGEVASTTVADAVRDFIAETERDRDRTWPFAIDPELSVVGNRLRAAILIANRLLSRRISEDEELRGMATTLSAALLTDRHAVVSNVGDCRAYLLRQGGIRQITLDHSWVAEQVRAGLLTADAARAHPWRSMVTRAIAGTAELAIDVLEFDLEPGDRLLLCSDGLHGQVADRDIASLVAEHDGDLEGACKALIDAANANGGPDNITAVLVRV